MAVRDVLLALLAGTFTASAATKAVRWHETVEWFGLMRFPSPDIFARVAIGAEAALVAGLYISPRWGSLFAILGLSIATGMLILAHRRNAGCGCFGERSSIGIFHYLRNALLLATAAFLAITAQPSEIEAVIGVAVAIASAILLAPHIFRTATS